MEKKRMSEGEFPEPISYTITYGGGRGPDTWDGELTVKAKSIREAMDKADAELADLSMDGTIFCIEQED
jgi:hypothetical protein